MKLKIAFGIPLPILTRGLFKPFFLVLAIVLLQSCNLLRSYTPAIKAVNGIASLEKLKIGGIRQSVLIRGEKKTNPILLFLHGGPGMPMMYLSHSFQRELEKEFVVVHWDQRGAGKSYSKRIPEVSISDEQYYQDALELIILLRERFHQEKIFLAGHSWGTYLGSILVWKNPELFHAYLSIGQVVNSKKAINLQKDFITQRANWLDRKDALQDLEKYDEGIYEKWLFKFGGELRADTTWQPFVRVGLKSPEYSIFDALKIGKGSKFCSRNIKYKMLKSELEFEITHYQIPCYFLIGTSDMTTPYELVETYYQTVKAPAKQLILFGRSAHFPFFEEPAKFTRILLRIKHDVIKKK